jgi:hypothetical protein
MSIFRSEIPETVAQAEAMGDVRDRMTSRMVGYDVQRVYDLESQADLHALRAIGCSEAVVFVIRCERGFMLSPTQRANAITKWTRRGCTNLAAILPLVEVRY